MSLRANFSPYYKQPTTIDNVPQQQTYKRPVRNWWAMNLLWATYSLIVRAEMQTSNMNKPYKSEVTDVHEVLNSLILSKMSILNDINHLDFQQIMLKLWKLWKKNKYD